uniref:Uncharacterized protein n=1 Tax=Anguilla anguilla TaxID=7936 RepID=A0A0E9QLU2_ANGAN
MLHNYAAFLIVFFLKYEHTNHYNIMTDIYMYSEQCTER